MCWSPAGLLPATRVAGDNPGRGEGGCFCPPGVFLRARRGGGYTLVGGRGSPLPLRPPVPPSFRALFLPPPRASPQTHKTAPPPRPAAPPPATAPRGGTSQAS